MGTKPGLTAGQLLHDAEASRYGAVTLSKAKALVKIQHQGRSAPLNMRRGWPTSIPVQWLQTTAWTARRAAATMQVPKEPSRLCKARGVQSYITYIRVTVANEVVGLCCLGHVCRQSHKASCACGCKTRIP